MTDIKTSPYDWKFPVKDIDLFAGRKDELADIEKEVRKLTSDSPIPPVISVIGERNVGKTSLLLRVKEVCKKNKLATVWVNIENPMVADAWEFWHELISQFLITANDMGIGISGTDSEGLGLGFLTPSKSAESGTERNFLNTKDLWFSKAYRYHLREPTSKSPASYLIQHELDILAKCFLESDYKGTLLIFDEAQRLLTGRDIMQQLKDTLYQIERCGIIFAGQTEAAPMFSEDSEPFFGHVSVIPLKNFTYYDDIVACALLPLFEEERTLMSPMTIDHISRFSQSKPNQIRLICDAIYTRYANGDQDDLNITIDILDDVADKVARFYPDEQIENQIDNIRKLGSVDLELLYNMTRYPNWSVEDIIDLDEAFRGEAKSDLAYERRKQRLIKKWAYFTSKGLMSSDSSRYTLLGGEFANLYLRFHYEVHKYGKLLKRLILGKGPPTPFGEKTEKLVRSIAYTLGQSPQFTTFTVHQYYRDRGDLVETIRHRYEVLTQLMKGKSGKEEDVKEIITECFKVCMLVRKPGTFIILCLAIRDLDYPRDSIHVEMYFNINEMQGEEFDLISLFKIVRQQAKNARVLIESNGEIKADIPDLKGLLNSITGIKLEDLEAKLDKINRWKLASVLHVVNSSSESEKEGEEKEEEDEDELRPKWMNLHRSGDDKGAEEYLLKKILEAGTLSKRAWLYNDLGYIRQGLAPKNLDIAKADLDRAIKFHYPHLQLTLSNLSITDIDAGDYGAAIEKIEDALLLALSRLDISAGFLRLRLPENHLNMRVKWEQHPANVLEASYINLAYAVLKGRNYAEAKEVLEEGLKLLPSSIRLKHALARLYLYIKRANLAVPIYEELSKLPSLPDEGICQEIKVFARPLKKLQHRKK